MKSLYVIIFRLFVDIVFIS